MSVTQLGTTLLQIWLAVSALVIAVFLCVKLTGHMPAWLSRQDPEDTE